jgi:hypothetical protein
VNDVLGVEIGDPFEDFEEKDERDGGVEAVSERLRTTNSKIRLDTELVAMMVTYAVEPSHEMNCSNVIGWRDIWMFKIRTQPSPVLEGCGGKSLLSEDGFGVDADATAGCSTAAWAVLGTVSMSPSASLSNVASSTMLIFEGDEAMVTIVSWLWRRSLFLVDRSNISME